MWKLFFMLSEQEEDNLSKLTGVSNGCKMHFSSSLPNYTLLRKLSSVPSLVSERTPMLEEDIIV